MVHYHNWSLVLFICVLTYFLYLHSLPLSPQPRILMWYYESLRNMFLKYVYCHAHTFSKFLLRSSLTNLFEIATLYSICSICPLDSPHFFMLFSAPLFRTDISGLHYYSGFLLCLASGRPEDLKENLDICLPSSFLTKSFRDSLFPLSEITVFVRRLVHTVLCLSLFRWLLHHFDQDWGIITESYCILSFIIYLYFAHSFGNSPFRKLSSK